MQANLPHRVDAEELGGLPRALLDEYLKRAAGSPASGSADHRNQATHQATAGPDGLSGQRMEHATTSALRESTANHSGRRPYQIKGWIFLRALRSDVCRPLIVVVRGGLHRDLVGS